MEPIAVVGMGCRFPQANSPEVFWQILYEGREAVVPVPQDRWDIDDFYDPSPETRGKMSTRLGAFLDQVDGFDAEFFGMAADEVEHVDPQQRLFLEVAWEALEQGGILPNSLAGTATGVFIGLCTVDYHRLLYKRFDRIGPHSGTGTTMCITANRLSYLLDLRGPSLAIDAACSSSLVTVHLACQSLRSGESDLCLAGGVNLILSPDSTISSSQTRLLSKAGRCRPFDTEADGYVRGEGCGVVVLKRLSDARQDGDNILALIRGSAVNQDGLSNSLTAPNGLAQQAVIRRALDNSGVQPHEISYVEAHAVGTPLGDAIEFKALKAVLTEGRDADRPCWVGSAKPNIGHLEAASGMAALIKVILSLQHEQIPAHLHLDTLNPYISIGDAPMAIPTEPQPWPRGDQRRLAGISAFGFGGTNTHLVLQEAPWLPVVTQLEGDRPCHLLTLSAKTPDALGELIKQYETLLEGTPDLSLADLCFTANTGRTPFEHRLCVVAETISQLQQQLHGFTRQHAMPDVLSATVKRRRPPKVAFIFPLVGVELLALGRQLYNTQLFFRQAFDQCDRCSCSISGV
ncbi:MAG: type I polyketide synthase [Cyanobacteria bacterium P01_G01_bin.38]